MPKTEWKKVRLGDVADINMGQSPASKYYNSKGIGLPFYQGVTDFGEKYPNKSIYCDRPIKIAEPGAILFSVRAPVGDVNIATDRCCLGRGVASLTMKNGNKDFLYFLLKRHAKHFKSVAGGTTYESINKDQIEDIELNIPVEWAEQRRIASILSAFDDKIELNNKIGRTLEQMAQAIFKEWFVDFRFPGHEKAEFVESELGRVPKGWREVRLADLVQLDKGLSYTSAEISDVPPGLPLVNLKCFLRGGGFRLDGIKYYRGKYRGKHTVSPGEIVVAMTDLTPTREVVGRPARVPAVDGVDRILMSLDVCALRLPQGREWLAAYVYQALRQPTFGVLMANSASGTTVAHLSQGAIAGYPLLLPDENLIKKFHQIGQPVFDKTLFLESENSRLAEARDAAMHKIFKI
jgi:type I restriction enzyme S subunit